MPQNAWSSLLLLSDGMPIRILIFCGYGCIPFLDITSPKNGMDIHLKWHLSLFNFRLTSLHLCSTLYTVSSWSLPFSSKPTTRIPSAMPKTFGISLKISSIFHWNMWPAGAAPNSSHLYLYQPNWHVNVVSYKDLSSNFWLWYPDLASISEMSLTLLSFGIMLLNLGPLCMGLIKAWFSHAWSKHSLTLPLALCTNTKLLHHSAISLNPSGVIMSCCCSLSNSSLNSFCNAYDKHLVGALYGLPSGFSYNKNVPSKHLMPLNTSSNFQFICYVNSALFFCLYHSLDLKRKEFVDLFELLWTIDFLLLLLDFKKLSVFAQHSAVPSVSCFVLDSWVVLVFTYCSLSPMSSAPVESMFILIIWSASVSHMPNNAWSLPGTTKNWYFFLLFLCSIITLHVPNWVIVKYK